MSNLSWLQLPAFYGGMSLNDPVADLHLKHASSLECTTSFTALILQGELSCHVFYLHAPSYQSRVLPSLYRQFEGDKKHEYGESIREVEHGLFRPLVFSSCGGVDPPRSQGCHKLGFYPSSRIFNTCQSYWTDL